MNSQNPAVPPSPRGSMSESWSLVAEKFNRLGKSHLRCGASCLKLTLAHRMAPNGHCPKLHYPAPRHCRASDFKARPWKNRRSVTRHKPPSPFVPIANHLQRRHGCSSGQKVFNYRSSPSSLELAASSCRRQKPWPTFELVGRCHFGEIMMGAFLVAMQASNGPRRAIGLGETRFCHPTVGSGTL